MLVAVLKALGNMISGFSGALLLGTNLYGFLLGLGICVLFNLTVTLLTNRAFAKSFWEGAVGVLAFLGHLCLPFVVLAGMGLAFMALGLACYGIYLLCKTPWGEVIFVSLVFAFIIFMIVYALKPKK